MSRREGTEGRGPGAAARLALAVLGLLAGLALAEGLVRLTGVAPPLAVIERGRFRLAADPRIGYEPVPHLDYQGDDLAFYDYRGASNRLGYRDTEHPVAKPPGVYRILVLGDSIAAGLEVERLEDTFPRLLEGELRRSGVAAEVLNFAVSGYNTEQEVATLERRGLAFAPDLVLLAYCLNDRERVDGGILAALLADQRGGGVVNRLAAHPLLAESALYRFLRYRESGSPPPDHRPADTVEASFAALAGLAAEHRFGVLVAVFPRFHRLLRYRWQDEHRWVAALSAGQGFHHLDLLDAYRGCSRASPEPLSEDTWHPNAAGHRCAARALARFILDEVPISRH